MARGGRELAKYGELIAVLKAGLALGRPPVPTVSLVAVVPAVPEAQAVPIYLLKASPCAINLSTAPGAARRSLAAFMVRSLPTPSPTGFGCQKENRLPNFRLISGWALLPGAEWGFGGRG